MKYAAINFPEKLGLFNEHWSPKVIAQMNDHQFKLVRIQGDFVWHSHEDTDETFVVLESSLRIAVLRRPCRSVSRGDVRGDKGC